MSTGRRIAVLILMAIALIAVGRELFESVAWNVKGSEYWMGGEMTAEVDRLIQKGSLPAMDEKLKWEVTSSLTNAGRRAVGDRLASVMWPAIAVTALAAAVVVFVFPASRTASVRVSA